MKKKLLLSKVLQTVAEKLLKASDEAKARAGGTFTICSPAETVLTKITTTFGG
jgi:hypothetical protein